MQAINTGRQEYPLGGWQRGFCLFFGALFEGCGVFLVYLVVKTHNSESSFLFLSIAPFAFGIYMLATALRSRLVIDGSRVEVRYGFTEKTADLSQIEGYRTVSTRNSSLWQLKLKEGRGTITVQKSYDCDGLRSWLQQIPDLDERDRLPSAIVLALLPVVLIYLVRQGPLLYGIFTPKRDPRTDLGIAFMACGLGLIFGNMGVHFVEKVSLLEYAGLVGLLFCAGIFSAARKNPQFWGAMLGMLFIAGAYGFGLAEAADTIPDQAKPASYSATIENKHETNGRSTSYYLDLGPWGPMQGANSLSVSESIYEGASIGDQVCLDLRPGVLRVQWYQVVACARAGQ
jgi:hypothetical protein